MLNQLLRLERRARRNPQDGGLHCALAELRLKMNRPVEARVAIRHAETVVQTEAELVRLGRLLEQVEAHERALQTYLRLAKSPDYRVEALAGQARIAQAQGDFAQAVRLFSEAIWLAPRRADFRCALGAALMQANRLDEAIEQLRQALHIDDRHVGAWRLLAQVGQSQDSADFEINALQGLLRAAPDPASSIRLSHLLRAQNRAAEALELMQQTARLTRTAPVLCDLGLCQQAAGEPNWLTTFEVAAKLPDATLETRFQLGLALQSAGEHQRAVENFQTVFEQGLRDPRVYCHLAQVYVHTGQLAAAIDLLVQGAIQHRAHPAITRQLAEAKGSVEGTLPPAPVGAPAPALEGRLCDFGAVDLLEFLRLNRRTGALRLAADENVGEILLIEGNLAGASSTRTPPLGDMLINSGLVSREQLQSVVDTPDPRPLGRRLVEDGLMSIADLRRILHSQAQAAISEILQWADGHFVFRASDSLREMLTPEYELDTAQILLDALCSMDEGMSQRQGL